MILVALGSNTPGPWGSPQQTVARAIDHLNRGGLRLVRASALVVSAPFGVTDQPPFVNAVAEIRTALGPGALLRKLHAIERQAGRRRTLRWGPRTLDLDLLDYDGRISKPGEKPILPHPGIASRIFVLAPMQEIAPRWRHPLTKRPVSEMLRRLDPKGQGGLL